MPYTPMDVKTLRAMVAQLQPLQPPRTCTECHIPLRPINHSTYCDVCDTIIGSLITSSWFIDASIEHFHEMTAMIKHKRQLLDADED
jgi:hypothetical protein